MHIWYSNSGELIRLLPAKTRLLLIVWSIRVELILIKSKDIVRNSICYSSGNYDTKPKTNKVIAYWINVYTHFICTIVSFYIVHWMPLTNNIYDLRWLYTLCTCTELRSNWVNDLFFLMKIGICHWPIGNERLVIVYCYCCCYCCDWFLYWHLVCLLIR